MTTAQLEHGVTIDQFQAFIERPENAERRFELIEGEIVDVPSNPFVSNIATLISFFFRLFLKTNEIKGYVTGEGGGFVINGQVIAPDVAYMRDLPTRHGFEQTPPQLAVEVLSDPASSAEQTALRRKLWHYKQAGVTVWVADYVARIIEVHPPDGPVQVYDDSMIVPGGDILPGFKLAVKDIFPEEAPDESQAEPDA